MTIHVMQVGVDSLYGWSKVMAILELEDIQKTVKFNIKWIKENFFPSSYVSIKVPFLVVGLKSIHSTKNDVNCIVQDQTGKISNLDINGCCIIGNF